VAENISDIDPPSDSKDRCAGGAGRVHHCPHVADALFEGLLAHAVGEALASLVEDDDAREGREPLQQVLVEREFPEQVGVGQRARMRTRSSGPSPKTR